MIDNPTEPRTTIWLVTSGSYSDYSVNAVFTDEADAKAAVEAGYGEDVEERDLYGPGQQPRKVRYWRFGCEIDPETAEAFTRDWDPTISGLKRVPIADALRPDTHDDWLHPSQPQKARDVEATVYRQKLTNHDSWIARVEASDEELARRAFYDLVAKTRAEIVEGHR